MLLYLNKKLYALFFIVFSQYLNINCSEISFLPSKDSNGGSYLLTPEIKWYAF